MTQDDLNEIHRLTLTTRYPHILVEETDGGLMAFLLQSDKELIPAIVATLPLECGSDLSICELEDRRDQRFASDCEWVSHIATELARARLDEDEKPPKAFWFEHFRLIAWVHPDACLISIYPDSSDLKEVARPAVALSRGLDAAVLIEKGQRFLRVLPDLTACCIANSTTANWRGDQPVKSEIQRDFCRLVVVLTQSLTGLRLLFDAKKSAAPPIRFFEDGREVAWSEVTEQPWTARMQQAACLLMRWTHGQGPPDHTTFGSGGGTLCFAVDNWRLELPIQQI